MKHSATTFYFSRRLVSARVNNLDVRPRKRVYLLVELGAAVFRPSGTVIVSSGCTEFGVSAHTECFRMSNT